VPRTPTCSCGRQRLSRPLPGERHLRASHSPSLVNSIMRTILRASSSIVSILLAMLVTAVSVPYDLTAQARPAIEHAESMSARWLVEPHAGLYHDGRAGNNGEDRWGVLAGLRLERAVSERMYATGTLTFLRRANAHRNVWESSGLTYASEGVAATIGVERKHPIASATSVMLGAEFGAGWSRYRESDSFGNPTPGMRTSESWGSVSPVGMVGAGLQQRVFRRAAASLRVRYLVGPSEVSAWKPSVALGLVFQ